MRKYPQLPDDLPKTKFDSEAIRSLEVLSFQEIEPYLSNLFVWVQDLNWPISGSTTQLIRSFGAQATPAIKAALTHCKTSNDSTWAHNIIELFVKPLEKEVIALFSEELQAWWFHDNIELKILIFEIMTKNKVGEQAQLKKWVKINRKSCEEFAENLRLIEKELDSIF